MEKRPVLEEKWSQEEVTPPSLTICLWLCYTDSMGLAELSLYFKQLTTELQLPWEGQLLILVPGTASAVVSNSGKLKQTLTGALKCQGEGQSSASLERGTHQKATSTCLPI